MPLVDPTGRPFASSLADTSEKELLARLAEEMHGLMLRDQQLGIQIDALQAIQLAGLLQLALRHPEILAQAGEAAHSARELLDAIRGYFTELGADYVLEVIRRGDDAAADAKPHAARIGL